MLLRRILIVLALIVLVAVSVGIGVFTARPSLWQQFFGPAAPAAEHPRG